MTGAVTAPPHEEYWSEAVVRGRYKGLKRPEKNAPPDAPRPIVDLSPRTLRRWYTPGERGYCGFPAPVRLGDRLRFFRAAEIREWEAAQVARRDRRPPGFTRVAVETPQGAKP